MSLPTKAAAHEPLVRYARKLSHDLNNFSTVVRTYSELLLADLPPDSATYADVEEIQRAAENMVQYLQRVTRFSRAGTMKRTTVDVDALAGDAVTQFTGQVASRPVEARMASGATIQADAIWCRDIITELLQNAHEASPAEHPIVLETRREGAHVLVCVSDHGAGFPDAIAAEAAEPMVTGKTGVRGAGLGLTLVAAFVEAVGGSLSQEHRDGRTTVTVRMPAN